MKGDKTKWIRSRNGSYHNISIGSNCKCWMCRAVMTWVNKHHWSTGKKRQQFAEKLIDYLCYRMGYAGCKTTTLQQTLPEW